MGGWGGGGYAARLFLLFSFPCSADHERDWPPCKVVFFGLATNTLNARNKQNKQTKNVAMADGTKKAIFLRYLRSFIFPDRDVGCTLIHEDNVSAIHLACNPATTPNSKHIDIRHHFIRERVERGGVKVVHVRSNLQRADFLTKPLPKELFCAYRDFVMNIR